MTQRKELEAAQRHVRCLVVQLARRRPMKFPAVDADNALAELQVAQGIAASLSNCLARVEAIYEKHQGPAPRRVRERQAVAALFERVAGRG